MSRFFGTGRFLRHNVCRDFRPTPVFRASLFFPVDPCLPDASQKPVPKEAKQESPNDPAAFVPFKAGVAGRDETDCDQVIIQPFWQFAHTGLLTLSTFLPFARSHPVRRSRFETTPAVLAVAMQGVLDYGIRCQSICDFLHLDRLFLQLFVVLEKAP